MAKRVFDSAFTANALDGLYGTARSGSEAQLLHDYAPSPASALCVPGQWPRDDSFYSPGQPGSQSGHVAAGSIFTTIGKWAATIALPNLFALPMHLAQRFLRRQTILVQPIVREDGARKKRIISAGLAEEPTTPSPSQKARAAIARRRDRATPGLSPANDHIAGGHIKSVGETSGQDDDESLDFSMEDVMTGTPLIPHSVSTQEASPALPKYLTVPFQGFQAPKLVSNLSPTTHRRILDKAHVTPLRKKLVKNLLSRANVPFVPAQAEGDHTKPIVRSNELPMPSALQEHVIKATLLRIRAQGIADERQAQAKLLEKQTAEEQKAEDDRLLLAQRNAYFNVHETVDDDLSFLPNASDHDVIRESSSEFDDLRSERSDMTLFSPSPFKSRKQFRWSSHANVKEFYFDEKVSEMLDSSLESILSNPRPREEVELEFEDEVKNDEPENGGDVDGPEISFLEASSDSDNETSESVGFTGVPPETFEDSEDYLEESEMSSELLQELHTEMQKVKLSMSTSSLPTVTPKELVTPLSSQERDELNAVAAKTDYGMLPQTWIIEEKVSAYDFGTLLPLQFNGSTRAWLNDNIVNEYLAILNKEMKQKMGFQPKRGGPAPPLHVFSSFWYTTARKKVQNVERWAGRFQLAGEQYLDANLLLYPICHDGHWRLLVVRPKERSIEYLDSMKFDGTDFINKMKEYLAMELKSLYIPDEWTVVKGQRSALQINGSDCGVFTILNCLTLMRGEALNRLQPNDGMQDARERIAVTLINGTCTAELE